MFWTWKVYSLPILPPFTSLLLPTTGTHLCVPRLPPGPSLLQDACRCQLSEVGSPRDKTAVFIMLCLTGQWNLLVSLSHSRPAPEQILRKIFKIIDFPKYSFSRWDFVLCRSFINFELVRVRGCGVGGIWTERSRCVCRSSLKIWKFELREGETGGDSEIQKWQCNALWNLWMSP